MKERARDGLSAPEKRALMVGQQLSGRGITDQRVLEAMRKVPREAFFPEALREFAYADNAFSIGEGQTISQPYMVAKMTECLRLSGRERVLEIGTGSGYQAAVLAELASGVYSIECLGALSGRAKEILEGLGYRNIFLKVGDGTYGWKKHAPYDRIIVTAGASRVPPELMKQLSGAGGILVIPLGTSFMQMLKVISKKGSRTEEREECACHFVPFVGPYAYR